MLVFVSPPALNSSLVLLEEEGEEEEEEESCKGSRFCPWTSFPVASSNTVIAEWGDSGTVFYPLEFSVGDVEVWFCNRGFGRPAMIFNFLSRMSFLLTPCGFESLPLSWIEFTLFCWWQFLVDLLIGSMSVLLVLNLLTCL